MHNVYVVVQLQKNHTSADKKLGVSHRRDASAEAKLNIFSSLFHGLFAYLTIHITNIPPSLYETFGLASVIVDVCILHWHLSVYRIYSCSFAGVLLGIFIAMDTESPLKTMSTNSELAQDNESSRVFDLQDIEFLLSRN